MILYTIIETHIVKNNHMKDAYKQYNIHNNKLLFNY